MKSRIELLDYIYELKGNDTIGIEVGVLRGAFTKHILEHLKPKELHLVDTWGMHLSTFKDYKNLDIAKWNAMYQSILSKYGNCTIKRGLSVEVSKQYNDGVFDFIYIDADHDKVLEDILAWYPKLKKGGIICGHDYNLPQVKHDVKEMFGEKAKHTKETLSSWYVI